MKTFALLRIINQITRERFTSAFVAMSKRNNRA